MAGDSEKVLLKDQLFHRANVTRVAGEIAAVYPAFATEGFIEEVMSRLSELELKQRIAWISTCLRAHLPSDYQVAGGVLVAALPAPCDPSRGDDDFGEFIYAPYSNFVASYGCVDEHFETSIEALREMTTRFSAEDAIRPFINAFPERTMGVLQTWTADPHYHVRRLCTEGTRPLLPWSGRLKISAEAAVPILDALVGDETRFVTRSIANHVNDLSKIDPDLAIGLLERWRATSNQKPDELSYIVRHSTRTLVKKGDRRTLELIGIDTSTDVAVTNFVCADYVALGEALTFSFDIETNADAEVIIDYAIRFHNKSGRGGRKVFKLRRARLPAYGPRAITHQHALRVGMTTRTIIPGLHHLEVLANGQLVAESPFTVH